MRLFASWHPESPRPRRRSVGRPSLLFRVERADFARVPETNREPTGLIARLKSFLAFPGQFKTCAVCVPDGAILVLYSISSKLQQANGLDSTEIVTFRQLSAEAQTYRDAVEFRNGVRIRVQELGDGQRVEVLTLSSEKADVPVEMMMDVLGQARP